MDELQQQSLDAVAEAFAEQMGPDAKEDEKALLVEGWRNVILGQFQRRERCVLGSCSSKYRFFFLLESDGSQTVLDFTKWLRESFGIRYYEDGSVQVNLLNREYRMRDECAACFRMFLKEHGYPGPMERNG